MPKKQARSSKAVKKARVSVVVMPKEEILDPQGKAVMGALRSLGFNEVSDVRIGRVVRLTLDVAGGDEGALDDRVRQMASSLLANPVTEDFTVVPE